MKLSVTIYERRIDSTLYHGFYNAIFAVQYHDDIRTSETPPAIIIDSIELETVDYLSDAVDAWQLFTIRNLLSDLRAYMKENIDEQEIREKLIDKAGTLTSHGFKELV